MPTLVNSRSTATRFELPALNFNFGKITDGTDIPPPPEEPVVQKVPTPPQTPPPTGGNKDAVKELNEQSKSTSTNEGQTSNGNLSVANGGRPTSQSGSSYMDDRKSKRSSGWFRRIRTGESKRSSIIFDSAPPTPTSKKPSGPPPPMIPELADLEKDEGSLGDDLFKNIK